MAYATVRSGSRGDDVRQLQQLLNQRGYGLDVDGIFGSRTQSAVRDWQQRSGLTVDGIVGKNTWGSLLGGTESDSDSGRTAGSAALDAEESELNRLLQSLLAQQQGAAYTPKSAEALRAQAEGEFASYYDRLRLAARQQQETGDLALRQQRDALEATYDAQREQSTDQYKQAYSQADRQLLSRGMQRSSYAAQTLSNVALEGAQAQQAIGDQQAAAEQNIDQQRALLAQQLASQLAQYDANEAADILQRIRELEDQEYDRSLAASDRQNSLSMQIYQLLYQQERDRVTDAQWQAQFDASTQGGGGGGGGSARSGNGQADAPPDIPDGLTWEQFDAMLGYNWGTDALSGALLGLLMGQTQGTKARVQRHSRDVKQ